MKYLKFRLWNYRTKEFENSYAFALKCNVSGENTQILESSHLFAPFTEKNFDNFDIQQYTGFNDYNDNPVYEGDIVDISCGYHNELFHAKCGEVIYSEEYLTYFVKIYNSENYYSEYLYCLKDNCCVVGNIFEDIKLLPFRNKYIKS